MNITDKIETANYYLFKGLRIAALTGLGFLVNDALAPADAYAKRPKPTITTEAPDQTSAAQAQTGAPDISVSIPDVPSVKPQTSGIFYTDDGEASQPTVQSPVPQPAVQPAAKGPGVYINDKLVKRQPTPVEKAALARAERDALEAHRGKMPYCDTLPASCTSHKIGKYNQKPKDCDSYKSRGRYYAGTVSGKPVVDFTNDQDCLATDTRMNWQDWLNGWYSKHAKKDKKGKAPAAVVTQAPAEAAKPAQPEKPAVVAQPEEPTVPGDEVYSDKPLDQDKPLMEDGWEARPVADSSAQSPQKSNAVSFGYKQIIRGNNQNDTYLAEVGYDRALGRFIVGVRALVGAQYPNVSNSTPQEKGQTVPDPQSLDQMFSREYTYKTTSEGKGMLDTFGLQAVAGLNVYQKDDGSFGIDVLLKGGAVAVLTETEDRSLVQAVQSPNDVLSQRSAPTSTNNEARWYPDFGGEVRFNLDNYFLGVGGGVTGVSNPKGNVTGSVGFRF